MFGYYWVLLGIFGYFWVFSGIFGYFGYDIVLHHIDIVSISYHYCIGIVSIHIARPWGRNSFVCHFQTHATVALLGLLKGE